MPHSTLAAPLNYRTVSGSDRMPHSTLAAPLNYRTVSGSDRTPHSTLAAPLNYRTVSGPGSPARQPRWGGGSDRMLHSTADSLAEVMTEQDLIKAVNYVCMTKANLDLD